MDRQLLEIAQLLDNHPISEEKDAYKIRYINTIGYFAMKYSKEKEWSKKVLELYINALLDNPTQYTYMDEDIRKISRGVLSRKMKKFKFFSYRYSLLIDCLHITASFSKDETMEMWNEISSIYSNRYIKKLHNLYEGLYAETVNVDEYEQIHYIYEKWIKNKNFISRDINKILVTANMSAGKSTLLNALIGKKVNRTQNDACTSKIHYLVNKAFKDNFDYEWDFDLELDASNEVLMTDNENNGNNEITVGTRFRTLCDADERIYFIDTPGVNSSQDKIHKEISENAVCNIQFTTLLYLLNGENIGTDDDREHLRFILDNYKGKIIFAVNKLDSFRSKEDSIKETLDGVKKDLTDLGFENPIICPISAYAGFLAKMKIYEEKLNEDERDEYELFEKKLQREEFQFNTYYSDGVKEKVNLQTVGEDKKTLLHSGVLSLETMLYSR